jgi:hypothetical protein
LVTGFRIVNDDAEDWLRRAAPVHGRAETRIYVQRPVMSSGAIEAHVSAAQREIGPVGTWHDRPVREGLTRPWVSG